MPQLAGLDIDRVVDEGVRLVVEVRAQTGLAPCPVCGQPTGRVHGHFLRRVADLPVAGRALVLVVRLRRLRCDALGCRRRTFREQLPAPVARYARRTVGLAELVVDVGVAVAGRAGAAMLARFGVAVSRVTVLRKVMAAPVASGPAPAVLSVDDFAIRRGHRYATLVIDPVTGHRIDVLPDRTADTLARWLAQHPQVGVVCRDGSAAYAEAIRTGAPDAVQVSDRWHLWNNLGKTVEKTVAAHSGCWHTGPGRQSTELDERTRSRHAAVHELLGQGLGLGACARRLGWAMNTVKRYARAATADDLLKPAKYGKTLVDPYRDHLRRRRAEQPDVPLTHLLDEIRALGYSGSANLLVRYLNQGRADPDRTPPAPRRLASWLMTRPERLPEAHRQHLAELLTACPHLRVLAERVAQFARILTQRRGGDLDAWLTTTEADALPALHSFARGLRKDLPAVTAGLTLPYSNGPIEGANTKVNLLKRQMYGRAGFALLRQRTGVAPGHAQIADDEQTGISVAAPSAGGFVERLHRRALATPHTKC